MDELSAALSRYNEVRTANVKTEGDALVAVAAVLGFPRKGELDDLLRRVNDMDAVEEALAYRATVLESDVVAHRETKDQKCTILTVEPFAAAFAEIEGAEGFEIPVGQIVINPRDYADLRRWGRDVIDIETRAAFLRKGLMAVLWGALIFSSREQPVGEVLVMGAEPGTYGRAADDNPVNARGFAVIKVTR